MHIDGKHQAYAGDETTSVTDALPPITATEKSGAGETIGTTTYDLQTNSANCQRIVLDQNGGVHTVWTYSQSFDLAATDRGTGYSSRAPASGLWSDAPTSRIESDRVGWPNIGVTDGGKVFVVAHYAGASTEGLSWAELQDDGWVHNDFPINHPIDTWPRIATSGNTIHVICSSQRADGDEICGILGGLRYYRSSDEGETFEEMPCFDGLDATNFPFISGDGYDIDANGDNVAIIVGFMRPVLFKSTDGGDTWAMRVVKELSDPLYQGNEGQALDLVVTGDEGYSLLIDDNGTVHIWYGRNVVQDDDDATAGWTFFPANNGLMYWNDGMSGEPTIIGETVRQDMDGDCEAMFDFNASDAQAYFTSLVSMPSAGMDADGNLYVSYSSIVEGAFDANNNVYRDVFLIKSTDNGANWIGPYNVTNNPSEEAVFSTIAERVTDVVHLIYQSDDFTGMAVQPDPGSHAFTENSIQYVAVPVEDIAMPDPDFNTCPQLTISGVVPFALEACEVGPDRFEAVIIDYPDGDLNDDLVVSGVDINTPTTGNILEEITGETGPWILSVTDSDGNNQEIEFLLPDGEPFLVPVFTDDIPPEILGGPFAFVGPNNFSFFPLFDTIDVVLGTTYEDAGALIFDLDGDLFGCPPELTTNNPVDVNTAGEYFVTYDGVDHIGNTAETVTRVVNVIGADLEVPQILLFTGLSGADSLMNCGETLIVEAESGVSWTDPGYFAWDNVDGIVTDDVSVDNTVNLEVLGTYEVTYTISDDAGNPASCSRFVEVVDTELPIISLLGPPTLVNPCGQEFVDPGATAFDNVDGNLTEFICLSGTIDVCTAGTYILTYFVEDQSSNLAEVNRNVIVPSSCGDPCPVVFDPAECPVGIESNSLQNSLHVYPNPTQGILNVSIDLLSNSKASLAIYDLAGKQVQGQNDLTLTGSQTIQLDLTNQTAGMYFVRLVTDEGTAIHKVVLDK